MHVCSKCGSDQIRESAMLDYNTREEIRSVFDDIWCDDCDCETEIVDKDEFKENNNQIDGKSKTKGDK